MSPDLPEPATPDAPAQPPLVAATPVASRGRPAPGEPHGDAEIRAALWNPLAMVDLVLATPARLVANVERREHLGALALALLVGAVAFSVPFGLVLGLDSWWRVAVLYLGSTLICLPSLHVFSAYLGLRVTFTQSSVLALTIPAAAAIVTCGFAPILGFLRLTFDADARQVSWRAVSVVLLVIALLCGVVQLWRCLYLGRRAEMPWFLPFVWAAWHLVFGYVLLRMAHVLGLSG